MRAGIPKLFKDGYKQFTGIEGAILTNIEACIDLADMTNTSFGPSGMNKIVINQIDKVFVTSDAATIMKELAVQHPAAKVMCLAATMQEKEMGDGTNFVIAFSGELLRKAQELIHMGVHPSDIIKGYNIAMVKAKELMEGLVYYTLKDVFDEKKLAEGVKTTIAAKQFGLEDMMGDLVAKAAITVMPRGNPQGFNVDNVRILKLLGGDVNESHVVRGLALDCRPQTSCKKKSKVKVAVFTCSVAATQTETKGTILLNSASELLNYSKSEEDHMHKIIKTYKDMGVEMIVSGEKFSDMALHFMNKYNMMSLRIFSKYMLRRVCRLVGARPCVTLDGARTEDFGFLSNTYTKEIGERIVTILEQDKDSTSVCSTIVLRGATDNQMNDMERAASDAVNVVKQITRDARFVPGAGAAELQLASLMSDFASKQKGLEQYAIQKYAEALEIVPRQLASNSGHDGNKAVADLYAAHAKGENKTGVNVASGGIADMTQEGVMDLLATRLKGLALASKAALTILRVDHIIMRKPAGGPKKPKNRGHWDDNDSAW